MKTLLVEPNYRNNLIPLGLMKISSMLSLSDMPHEYVRGKKIRDYDPETIYITTMFTFWYKITLETILFYKSKYPKAKIFVGGVLASLMPEFIKKMTGINPHVGLLGEAERLAPNYDLVGSDYSVAFTSRGCPRKCRFCIVPKIEGKLYDIPDWDKGIDISKQAIRFYDNNFFAKGIDLIKRDGDIIRSFHAQGVKTIDFNQGLDARLFTEEVAAALQGIVFAPMRFAFDHMGEDGHVQKAIAIAKEYGFAPQREWKANGSSGDCLSVYILYNFNDTPKDFYYRLREVVRCGAQPFPMQFSPHADLERKYVGKHWTKTQRNAVKSLTNNHGQVSSCSREEFEYYWGKDEEEFIDIISNPNYRKAKRNKIDTRKIAAIRKSREKATTLVF